MQTKDILNIRGEFRCEIFDGGELVETYHDPNVITTVGRGQLARLLANAVTGRSVTKIGFGEATSAASPSDTGLSVSAFIKTIGTATYPTGTSVQFAWTLGTSEANGLAITEFGLICTDNTLFARKVRSVLNKTSSISLSGTWTIYL